MKTGMIGRIVAFVLIIAALVGLIGIVYSLTNGFTTGIIPFYVTIGDKEIKDTTKGIVMEKQEPLTVKLNFVTTDEEKVTSNMYNVKVVPNTDRTKDFDFTVEGDLYAYRAVGELTAGFDIKKEADHFTIQPRGGLTEILSAAYGGKTVEDAMSHAYTDMYVMQISSADGEHTISVYFSIYETATGIQLDKGAIVF